MSLKACIGWKTVRIMADREDILANFQVRGLKARILSQKIRQKNDKAIYLFPWFNYSIRET